LHSAWARARLGDRKIGMAELRQALVARMEGNEKLGMPRFQGLLAELDSATHSSTVFAAKSC
jgi:hypothetical protein